MTDMPVLSLEEIEDLAFRALIAAGTSEANARPLAKATAATEADGKAVPSASRPAPSVIAVDAATGFAHPAIDPKATSGDRFAERMSSLVDDIRDQPGVCLPGDG